MTAAGRWQEAEDALSTSLRLYDAGMRAMRSGAAVRLADLRVRQGRWAEAAVLLADNESDAQAVLPLARLHRARGERTGPPRSSAGPSAPAGTTVLDAPVLALLAERSCAAGPGWTRRGPCTSGWRTSPPDARCRYVGALAALSAGALAGASGGDALPSYEAALVAFLRAGLPYEAARCRLAIARMLGDALARRSRWTRRGQRWDVFRAARRPARCGRGRHGAARPRRPHARVPAPGRPAAHRTGAGGAGPARRGAVEPADRRRACSSASEPWNTTSGASSPSSASPRGPRRWPAAVRGTACDASRTTPRARHRDGDRLSDRSSARYDTCNLRRGSRAGRRRAPGRGAWPSSRARSGAPARGTDRTACRSAPACAAGGRRGRTAG